jgi:hypothetical protein
MNGRAAMTQITVEELTTLFLAEQSVDGFVSSFLHVEPGVPIYHSIMWWASAEISLSEPKTCNKIARKVQTR